MSESTTPVIECTPNCDGSAGCHCLNCPAGGPTCAAGYCPNCCGIPSSGCEHQATWRKQFDGSALSRGTDGFRQAAAMSDEDTIFAVIDIFGRPHHAMFVRVYDDPERGASIGTNDPLARVEDIAGIYETVHQPIQIPGIAGDFLCVIYPFER